MVADTLSSLFQASVKAEFLTPGLVFSTSVLLCGLLLGPACGRKVKSLTVALAAILLQTVPIGTGTGVFRRVIANLWCWKAQVFTASIRSVFLTPVFTCSEIKVL